MEDNRSTPTQGRARHGHAQLPAHGRTARTRARSARHPVFRRMFGFRVRPPHARACRFPPWASGEDFYILVF